MSTLHALLILVPIGTLSTIIMIKTELKHLEP